MEPSRDLRILKRVAATVGAVILLLSGYVGSYASLFWLCGHGWLDSSTHVQIGRTVYLPLDWYQRQHLPGWTYMGRLFLYAYWSGRGEPIPMREQIEAGFRNSDGESARGFFKLYHDLRTSDCRSAASLRTSYFYPSDERNRDWRGIALGRYD